MRILFIGDVSGRSGRDAVTKYLPGLKKDLEIDFTIVNGENAAHGIGITSSICKQFYEDGADCITTGNHIWDQREIITYIDSDSRLLRPLNFAGTVPGRGTYTARLSDGRKVLVINAQGRLFIDPINDDPFAAVEDVISKTQLGRDVSAIFVDFHAEATSEKVVMGHYLDGRVSAVVGTHTHIPTADDQILPSGTAYQTDAGMTSDYDSVIGVQKEAPIQRFLRKLPTERFSPASGEATLCGTFIETDDKTGLARHIERIQLGGRLKQTKPQP